MSEKPTNGNSSATNEALAKQIAAEIKGDVVKELHRAIAESTRTARESKYSASATLRELEEKSAKIAAIEHRAACALRDGSQVRKEILSAIERSEVAERKATRMMTAAAGGFVGLGILSWVVRRVTNSRSTTVTAMLP